MDADWPARARRKGLAASVFLACALAGCERAAPPTVTVYASADESVARPVFERFEQETGIRVDAKFDTEATKTTGLASMLRAERARPRADVFWSNEQAANVALAAEGVTQPIDPAGPAADAARAWPAEWRDAGGRWFAFAGRARVIVYSTERVAAPPSTWTELVSPRWKGRIALADPRFGTTRSHFGAMKCYWDERAMPGYFEAFAEGLAENGPKVVTSGNAGVVDAVARGEADVGMTDTDDVFAAKARGLKVAMVFPRHARDAAAAGGGTFVIPNTVAVVAGCPHPEAAQRFVAFMLSASTERALASVEARHAPLVSPRRPGDLEIADPLQVDPGCTAGAADGAVASFLDSMRSAGEGR